MVTVDMPLFRYRQGRVEVLLIQRDRPPFAGRWAMCGGFIEMDEPLIASAQRELQEETGLSGVPLVEVGVAGDPGRDPRGRTISVIFAGILAPPFPEAQAGDDARNARWFSLHELPPLAFDHQQVLKRTMEELRFRSLWRGYALCFMPGEFSRTLWQAFLAHFLGSEQSAEFLLQLGEQLGWISRTSRAGYRKNVENKTIFGAPFAEIRSAWEALLISAGGGK
jgi:8-oxo-dGTP diphosphatase